MFLPSEDPKQLTLFSSPLHFIFTTAQIGYVESVWLVKGSLGRMKIQIFVSHSLIWHSNHCNHAGTRTVTRFCFNIFQPIVIALWGQLSFLAGTNLHGIYKLWPKRTKSKVISDTENGVLSFSLDKTLMQIWHIHSCFFKVKMLGQSSDIIHRVLSILVLIVWLNYSGLHPNTFSASEKR